jgi:hypothetical protein
MTLIDGEPVAFKFTEYGVRYKDGTVHQADNEMDARIQADLLEAEAVKHDVYEMEWETL